MVDSPGLYAANKRPAGDSGASDKVYLNKLISDISTRLSKIFDTKVQLTALDERVLHLLSI